MPVIDKEKRKSYNKTYYENNKDKFKNSKKCEHNRQKSVCKDCKGSGICEHNKVRSRCKECNGGSICEHNKRRSICRE